MIKVNNVNSLMHNSTFHDTARSLIVDPFSVCESPVLVS